MGALRVRVIAGFFTTELTIGIAACAPTSSKSIQLPERPAASTATENGTGSADLPEDQLFGLSREEFEAGRTYVNGWDGEADEIPASGKWKVVNVAPADTPSTSTASTTATTTSTSTETASTPANPQVVETETEVTFRILKGTGSGAWNTKETEVVAKVGKKFTIQNDDDVAHQWHTNGTPCRHGNLIQPGQSESCEPNAKYSGSPVLYDHNTKGQFFFRSE